MKFNLQLFANGDQGNVYNDSSLTMVNTGNIANPYDGVSSTSPLYGLTPEIKEFYSKDLIEQVGPNLIHAQFGTKVTLPKGSGKTIEWRKWSKFSKALTPLTEGVTPVASTITVSPIRKTLSQYGAWSMVTDILQLTAIDNTVVEITSRHAENASLTLDTIVRNELIAGCTQELFAGGVNTMAKLNGKITANDVAKAATELKKKNAPKIDGAYVAIIHPAVAYDLITSADWIDVHKYSDAVKIFDGEIGKLYGVRFVESTEALVNKGKTLGTGTAGKCTSAVVTGYSSSDNTYVLSFAANTFTANELDGKKIYIHDVSEASLTIEEATVKASGTATGSLTLSAAPSITPAAGDIVYLSDSANALDGEDYFTCIFLAKDAYKVVALDGNNMEVIVKPNGSSGADDPLNQRASIGWKANGYGAAVTIPDYVLKYYCKSSIVADAN